MAKEIIIPHEEISNPQTITEVQEKKFKEAGLNMHLNEVDNIDEDFVKKVRRLKIRNVKYFGNWRHRG